MKAAEATPKRGREHDALSVFLGETERATVAFSDDYLTQTIV